MSGYTEKERRAVIDVQEVDAANSDYSTKAKEIASFRAISALRWITAVALIEFTVVGVTAYFASFIYHQVFIGSAPSTQQYVASSLLLAILALLICLVDNQYDFTSDKWDRRGIPRAASALALAFVLFISLNFLLKIGDDYSRGTLISQLALVFPALLVTRTLLILWTERIINAGAVEGRKLIVVSLAKNSQHKMIAQKLGQASDKIIRWYNLDIFGSASSRADARDVLERRLSSIQDECRKRRPNAVVVVFSAENFRSVAQVVEALYELPVIIQLLPVGLVSFLQRSRIAESGRLHVLEINFQPSLVERAAKRGIDLILSMIAVIMLTPLLLLIAAAIKLDSRGPILFRQRRHGFFNEPINVLKFRTMIVTDCAKFQQTAKNDPRVTPIGYFLRRTNIDELPQLFNVIRGNMSLVGPRPHAVEHNEAFEKEIRLLNRRHAVKPGITGWAQVNGFRGATDTNQKMQDRIEYDLYYVDNWSISFDIKILFMTLFSKKAYFNAY